MAYTKKEWVDVPNASSLSSEELDALIPRNEDGTKKQDALCRCDAANMNRIEEGIAEALAMTPDDIGALSKTIQLNGKNEKVDVLEITEDGWYYCYSAINVPTDITNGYLKVHVATSSYRVICWRPANSPIEYVNVFSDKIWRGWTEVLTSKGGVIRSEQFPRMRFAAGEGDKVASIMKNAGTTFDYGLLLSDYNDNSESESINLMLSYKSVADNSSMNYALRLLSTMGGTAKYYNVFGEHNKPSGTYTGSGGARTVIVGGVGNFILISSEDGREIGIVTSYGLLEFSTASTDHFNIENKDDSSGGYFVNGVLTLGDYASGLNKKQTIYRYQVL